MSVETSNSLTESPLETFRILYKGGQRDYVRAYTIRFEVKGADVIRFFNSPTEENEKLYLNAAEVASVIPHSSMVEAPLINDVQNQLSLLTERVDSIENNLAGIADIVTHAVNAAFTQRGL